MVLCCTIVWEYAAGPTCDPRVAKTVSYVEEHKHVVNRGLRDESVTKDSPHLLQRATTPDTQLHLEHEAQARIIACEMRLKTDTRLKQVDTTNHHHLTDNTLDN